MAIVFLYKFLLQIFFKKIFELVDFCKPWPARRQEFLETNRGPADVKHW
jgi:hypothetical protein